MESQPRIVFRDMSLFIDEQRLLHTNRNLQTWVSMVTFPSKVHLIAMDGAQ